MTNDISPIDYACPWCGASAGQPCSTAKGKTTQRPHKIRTPKVVEVVVDRPPLALEAAVVKAVGEATWFTATDHPKIAAALIQARQIDEAVALAEAKAKDSLFPDLALAYAEDRLTYDLDTLGRALDSLGLSPRGRQELSIEVADPEADPVGEIVGQVVALVGH